MERMNGRGTGSGLESGRRSTCAEASGRDSNICSRQQWSEPIFIRAADAIRAPEPAAEDAQRRPARLDRRSGAGQRAVRGEVRQRGLRSRG